MTNKRLDVGLQVTQLRTRYCQALLHEAQLCATRDDVNLWVFVGGAYGATARQEAASGVVYEFANRANIDGLVIAAGPLFYARAASTYRWRELPFTRLPAVALGSHLVGTPSVMPDNRGSFRSLVEHLVDTHGYTDIAFLSGVPSSVEGAARLQGWRDALLGRGLPATDSMVWPGALIRSSGVDTIRRMLDEGRLPRALACANDEMAIGVMEECARLGIRVPADLAVVGFDNTPESQVEHHNLTTVDPCYGDQMRASYDAVRDLVAGCGRARDALTSARVVVRASCGCPGLGVADIVPSVASSGYQLQEYVSLEAHFVNAYIGRPLTAAWATEFASDFRDAVTHRPNLPPVFWLTLVRRLESIIMRTHPSATDEALLLSGMFSQLSALPLQTAMATRATASVDREDQLVRLNDVAQELSSAASRHDLFGTFAEVLSGLGVHDCQIYLYTRPFVYEPGDVPWTIPSGTQLAMNYRGGDLRPVTGREVEPKRLVDPSARWDDQRHTVLVLPVTHGVSQLGYALFGLRDESYFVYDALRVHLASAVNAVTMIEELHALSRHDDLTGLLNRRGFMELAAQNYAVSLRSRVGGVVVYLDLDYVKQINDLHGHLDGDEALRAAALAIRTSLRETDICGRIGGDEFAALLQAAGPAEAELVLSRVECAVEAFNLTSGRPWRLGLTAGYKAYCSEDGLTLAESLALADAALYAEKRVRQRELSAN